MAPLYTVLLCVPAVLALFIAVGGLVLLRSRRQGHIAPPRPARGGRDGRRPGHLGDGCARLLGQGTREASVMHAVVAHPRVDTLTLCPTLPLHASAPAPYTPRCAEGIAVQVEGLVPRGDSTVAYQCHRVSFLVVHHLGA